MYSLLSYHCRRSCRDCVRGTHHSNISVEPFLWNYKDCRLSHVNFWSNEEPLLVLTLMLSTLIDAFLSTFYLTAIGTLYNLMLLKIFVWISSLLSYFDITPRRLGSELKHMADIFHIDVGLTINKLLAIQAIMQKLWFIFNVFDVFI